MSTNNKYHPTRADLESYRIAVSLKNRNLWRFFANAAERPFVLRSVESLESWLHFLQLDFIPEEEADFSGGVVGQLSTNVIVQAALRARSVIYQLKALNFLDWQDYPLALDKRCCKPLLDYEKIALEVQTLVCSALMDTTLRKATNVLEQPVKQVYSGVKRKFAEQDDYDDVDENSADSMNEDAPSTSMISFYDELPPDDEEVHNLTLQMMYHTMENDDQIEENADKLKDERSGEGDRSDDNFNSSGNLSAELASSIGITHIKHLLERIENYRNDVGISDAELKSLFSDFKPGRSKWADDTKIGQEELYLALENVLGTLKSYIKHSHPFLSRVSRRDAPDYYEVIRRPMDLGTISKKLKNFAYRSKKEFEDDLYLIYENCFEYNTEPTSIYRVHAQAMRERSEELLRNVPDITIRYKEFNEPDADYDEDSEHENSEHKQKSRSPSMGPSKDSTKENLINSPLDEEKNHKSALCSKEENLMKLSEMDYELSSSLINPDAEVLNLKSEEEEISEKVEEVQKTDIFCQLWEQKTLRKRTQEFARRLKEKNLPFEQRTALIRDPLTMQKFCINLLNHSNFSDCTINELSESLEGLMEYDISSGISELWDYTKVTPIVFFDSEFNRTSTNLSLTSYKPYNIPQTGTIVSIKKNITCLQRVKKLHNQLSALRLAGASSSNKIDNSENSDTDLISQPALIIDQIDPNITNIDGQAAFSILSSASVQLLVHAGFDGPKDVQSSALDIFTELFENYLVTLGQCMVSFVETMGQSRNPMEAIDFSLRECGVKGAQALTSYIQEDVYRYGNKLRDVLRMLETSFTEMTNGGLKNEEDFLNEENFTSGMFLDSIEGDFFGLKELGIDTFVPPEIWKVRTKPARFGASGGNGATTGITLPYPPPPAFEPVVTSEGQIGLLKDFIDKKLAEYGPKLMEDEYLPKSRKLKTTKNSIINQKKRPLKTLTDGQETVASKNPSELKKRQYQKKRDQETEGNPQPPPPSSQQAILSVSETMYPEFVT